MKKSMKMVLTGAMFLTLLSGCSGNEQEVANPADNKENQNKIAVIRNLIEDDHTTQYIAGAVEEGEAAGYVVESFISQGDDEKTAKFLEDVIAKNYAGIILSHGTAEYSTSLVNQAVSQGMKVVSFDTVFEHSIPEVTETMQNDEQLATLSMNALIENKEAPVNVVKVYYSGGLRPFESRNAVYRNMELDGSIKTVGVIDLDDLSNVQADVEAQLTKILESGEQVDGVWAMWDEMAKGAITALNKANRTDITLTSIDISEKDRELMEANGSVWTAAAAVDARMIGSENMKTLIKKIKGEETSEREIYDGKLYKIVDGKVTEQ